MKNKLKVIKKIHSSPCYVCSEIGGKPDKKSKCRCCKGTGIYKESSYLFIHNGYAIDGDNLS